MRMKGTREKEQNVGEREGYKAKVLLSGDSVVEVVWAAQNALQTAI